MNEIHAQMLDALRVARTTIKAMHDSTLMSLPETERANLWRIYDGTAPEMQRINAAIRAAERRHEGE